MVKTLLEIAADLYRAKSNEKTTDVSWLQEVLKQAKWPVGSTRGKYRVSYESIMINGRVDCTLKIDDRIAVCIELKRPHIDLDEIHEGQAIYQEQALKYGAGHYVSRKGFLNPILTILTNSQTAYLIDCSREDALSHKKEINLTTEAGTKEFIELLDINNIDRADYSLPFVQAQRESNSSPFASNRYTRLLETIFSFINQLEGKYGRLRAIELSIYCLLLATARDNAIIPNQIIRRCLDKNDWDRLKKHFLKLFGDVFFDVKDHELKDFYTIYDVSRRLPVRLDIAPSEYIGQIYETILSTSSKNTTSYYTPPDMIEKIISDLNPTIKNSILDPTCGSGAILASCVKYAFEKEFEENKIVSEKDLLTFLSGVKGVDKDILACKIAKITLLAAFMKIVGDGYLGELKDNKEYIWSGKKLPRPKIVGPKDFFDYNSKNSVDIIIGNPPWDSLDHCPEEKNKIMESKDFWAVYTHKNDILCYVIEKSIKQHLNAEGRFAFVVKRQALMGGQYEMFVNYLSDKVEKIYDYGEEAKFQHIIKNSNANKKDKKSGNLAESIIIYGHKEATSETWSYIRENPRNVAFFKDNTKAEYFAAKYIATKGAESARDEIYVKFAEDYPNDASVKKVISNLTMGGMPRFVKKMSYFFEDGVPENFIEWSKKTVLEIRGEKDTCFNHLQSRKDVSDRIEKSKKEGGRRKKTAMQLSRESLSWRRDNSRQISGPLLIIDRTENNTNGSVCFFIDKTRDKYVHVTGKTCIGSISGSIDDLYFLAGLFSSKYFLPLCKQLEFSTRAQGGIFLSPEEFGKLRLPILSKPDSNKITTIVKEGTRFNNELSSDAIKEINAIFSQYLALQVEKKEETFKFEDKCLRHHFYKHKTDQLIEYLEQICESIIYELSNKTKITKQNKKDMEFVDEFLEKLKDIPQKPSLKLLNTLDELYNKNNRHIITRLIKKVS